MKLTDPRLAIVPELIGFHAVNPFADKSSSPRNIMMASHLSQMLPLCHGDEKIVQSGVERELGKYTMSVAPDVDCRVLRIIPRYRKNVSKDSISFSPETVIIYEDTNTYKLGFMSVPRHKSIHQHFGFDYVKSSDYNKLMPGSFLEKGTILADTMTKKNKDTYAFGLNLNVAFTTDHEVAEDGVEISESVRDRMKFKIYETRVVEFGRKKFPLNLYGTEDEYKPIPELGDLIHPSGILVALREYDEDMYPVTASKKDVMDIDVMFDECTYVRGPGGKIVDIKVYHSPQATTCLFDGVTGSLDKYADGLKSFYKELIEVEREVMNERQGKFGDRKIDLEPDLHRLLVEAHSMVDEEFTKNTGRRPVKLTKLHRRDPVDEYRIEFTVCYEMKPDIGFKCSDMFGGFRCK